MASENQQDFRWNKLKQAISPQNTIYLFSIQGEKEHLIYKSNCKKEEIPW